MAVDVLYTCNQREITRDEADRAIQRCTNVPVSERGQMEIVKGPSTLPGLFGGRKPALAAGPDPKDCALRQPIQPLHPPHHRDVVQACKLAHGALAIN